MANCIQLNDFHKVINRKIYVDANVLIFLFWPTGQFKKEEKYAKVYNDLRAQGNILCISIEVISEIINRAIRFDFSKIKDQVNPSLKYKEFRNSPEGKSTISDISTIVTEQILNHFTIVEKSFDSNDIKKYLKNVELDFVDNIILSICKDYNLVLLTHDSDFKISELDILTDIK